MHKLLIIGSGGREHALAWKLKQSPKVEKIFVAPGNAGTSQMAENVPIPATDVLALATWAEKNAIDFTVVGSDDALALGVVDEFQKRGLKIWGPNKAAAQIEASKVFAKDLMKKNKIPTAEYQTFTDYNSALNYLEIKGVPIVIKASGLALGKGVSVCKTLNQAKKFLYAVMRDKIFGDAGSEVVMEEFLQGQEFSVHAFCDGKNFKLLPTSQDHKAVYNGGLGPNTGGMGTIAPVPWVTNELMERVSLQIVTPALMGLKNLGSPFVGLLYPGLMACDDVRMGLDPSTERNGLDHSLQNQKSIKVIEFNSRFGDPETQSYMRLLKTDLFDILEACVNGTLANIEIEWRKKFACCIVLASGGYPDKYQKGLPVIGIGEAEKLPNINIFHAGTTLLNGNVVTNGGRVLGVTAIADDLQSALNKAYTAIKLISFEGMHYRTDIGLRSLNYSLPTTH